jgi:DNA-binding transcriptional LysR family regulator
MNRGDLADLTAFVAVADFALGEAPIDIVAKGFDAGIGSFRAAASRLGVRQAARSRGVGT